MINADGVEIDGVIHSGIVGEEDGDDNVKVTIEYYGFKTTTEFLNTETFEDMLEMLRGLLIAAGLDDKKERR